MINALLNNIAEIAPVQWENIKPFLFIGVIVWACYGWCKWLWYMKKEGMRTGRRIKY